MADIECDRERAVITLLGAVECQPDLEKVEWVAVAYETNWFPGQFIQADKERKEVEIHFLDRSATCKSWFIGQSFQVMEMKIKLGLKKVTIFLDV